MQVLGPVFIIGIMGFCSLSGKKRRQFSVFYCFILALVAFSFQPHTADDLYREYQNLDGIRQYGWQYFGMKESAFYGSAKFEGLYLTQLYYYLFSLLPVNKFLPAVTVFIVYFLQFRLIEKASARYQLSALETFCLYAFVLCTRETYMIMSGIRNQLAFTIAGYAIYIDLVEKRSRIKCFLVYIAMIFVHQSSIFIILFRLLCFMKSKKIRFGLAAIMLIWSELLEVINRLLAQLPSIPFVNSLIYKINIYTVNNGGNANNIVLRTRYLIYMITWIPIIVAVSMTIIKAFRCTGEELDSSKQSTFLNELMHGRLLVKSYACNASSNDIVDIGWFIIYNICFTIGSIMYYWLYLRSAMLLGIVGFIPSAVLFYDMYQQRTIVERQKTNYIVSVGVLCMIKLLVIMLYMNRNMDFSILGF